MSGRRTPRRVPPREPIADGLAQALFDQSPFSSVIYDADGKPLALNAAFTALWGARLEDVPEDYNVFDDPQLEAQGVIPAIRRAFAGEPVTTPPVRYSMAEVSTRGEGRTVWTQGHFHPLRDETGRVAHVVLTHIDITERVRTHEELQRAVDRTMRLQAVTAGFARALTADEVASVTLTEGLAAVGAALGAVFLVDASGTHLEAAASTGIPEALIGPWRRHPIDAPTLGGESARTRRAVYVQHRAERAERFPVAGTAPDALPVDAWAAVPIIQGERCFGVIVLGFDGERSFPSEERAFLEAFAQQCAQALDRTRLYEAEHAARRHAEEVAGRLEALQRATGELTAALTPREVADVVVRAAVPALGAARGSCAVLDSAAGTIEIIGAVGYPASLVARFRRLSVADRFPLTDAVREGAPIFLGTAAARAEHYPQLVDVRLDNGSGAMAAIPLRATRGIVGALGFNWPQDRSFAAEELAFIDALAQQCGQALERARLYEEERLARAEARAAADRLQMVADVARAVNDRSFEPRAAMEALADMLATRLGDQCVVRLVSADGEWLEPAAVRHRDAATQALLQSLAATERYHVGDGVTGKVFATGEPYFVPVADPDELRETFKRAFRPWIDRLGMRSVICVPLRGREAPLGTVFVARDADQRPYTRDDLALVADVASRAALALERSRLYDAERRAR
ncbi:MAG TPA: GAF domain-containing protein, partial [Gemmatimonadaceae bacterium]|nr:GAF domain-containing protein [Gemmatimonadaceae bacterium]